MVRKRESHWLTATQTPESEEGGGLASETGELHCVKMLQDR